MRTAKKTGKINQPLLPNPEKKKENYIGESNNSHVNKGKTKRSNNTDSTGVSPKDILELVKSNEPGSEPNLAQPAKMQDRSSK